VCHTKTHLVASTLARPGLSETCLATRRGVRCRWGCSGRCSRWEKGCNETVSASFCSPVHTLNVHRRCIVIYLGSLVGTEEQLSNHCRETSFNDGALLKVGDLSRGEALPKIQVQPLLQLRCDKLAFGRSSLSHNSLSLL